MSAAVASGAATACPWRRQASRGPPARAGTIRQGRLGPSLAVHASGDTACVAVCMNKDCKRKGAARTLKFFRQLAPDSVTVTEEICFDECGMGPNVQLQPSGAVVNGVKSMAEVASLLESKCVDGDQARAKLEALSDDSQ